MIYEKLYTWQKNLVDKYKDRESFGLFLDMGLWLGKTPIALGFAEENNCTKEATANVKNIDPASLKLNE